MTKDQAVRDAKDARAAASPILSLKNGALQRAQKAFMQATQDGFINPDRLAMADRLARAMKELAERAELEDPDSDDSEGEVQRKAKPAAKKARQAGLTLFSAQGKELESHTKAMKKALAALFLCLSTTELDTLCTQYTDEYHQILSTNDPRLLLALIERHWMITSSPRPRWTLRLVHFAWVLKVTRCGTGLSCSRSC